MKKVITLFLVLSLLLVSVVALYSCGDSENPSTPSSSSVSSTQGSQNNHAHIFASTWTQAESGHYRECTCHPEHKDIAPHSDSVDRDGKCDVCQYIIKEATVFTLTLTDEDGNPVKGAEVRMFTSSEDKVFVTDEAGVVSYGFIYYDAVKAIVTSVPEGYTDISRDIHRFDGTSCRVTVNKATPQN